MPVKSNWQSGEQFNASDANAVANAVNAAYVKPEDGIPVSDLDADVQIAVSRANSAVQSVDSVSITDSTTVGRSVLTAASASEAREYLGVAYGSEAGTVVEGNDSRLSPTAATIADASEIGRTVLTAEDADDIRDALGLAYGTLSGTVAVGDDARITGAEQTSNKGQPDGYAALDSNGKVPVSQLPTSAMEYKGTWDALDNSPALADGSGDSGDLYRVTVAATRDLGSGNITFGVGDLVIYDGSVWQKAGGTGGAGAVLSVNTKTGIVMLDKDDIGLGNVDNTSDADKPVSTAVQTELDGKAATAHVHPQSDITDLGTALDGKEPTVAAGTTSQYYRGDKTWQTLNKGAVGLGNVDNTADANKAVLSASKLTTARTINGVSFDGSANITVQDSTKEPAITAGTTSQLLRGDKAWQSMASANTSNAVVQRDASGNFSAGVITASLSGNASTATSADSATTATTAQYTTAGMPLNTNTTINARVIANKNTTASNDGLYIGYGNTNSGATRLYGGGNTTNAVTIGNGGTVTASGAISGTTLTSTVATGTAPISVASTTKVDNLNADLLDGYSSSSSSTASTVALRDSNKNLFADNFICTATSTATAGGTTTMTISSSQIQRFTGTAAQTIVLPTSGVQAGQNYTIINSSTQSLTVKSSALNTVAVLPASRAGVFTAITSSPTSDAHWTAAVTVFGKSFSVSNDLIFSGTDGTTFTFPSASGTVATTSGNVASATKLATARTIGGVSFNGTANINLPGVNTAGNQNTSGSAASLTTARTINGTSFNGTANITTANWGTARNLTVGGTAKSVNGSGNVSWSLAEIGADNASNLATGTVPDARLAGTYSGFTHKINGSNSIYTTPNTGSSNSSARTVYGLAEYRSSSSSQVGAIVFYAPNTTSSIMHQFDVAGLLYNQHIVQFTVQGYRTTGNWSDLRKISTGTADVQVRWGVDSGGKNCLILGDVDTTWAYPHFSIVRGMFSHTGAADAYCTGWTVGVVTSLSGFTNVTSSISDLAMVGSISGNAGSATKLATARTIGGVSFNGTANINLPGVNTAGNQNTSGSAAKLATARTVRTNLASTSTASFDGSANITPGVTGTLPIANGGTGATTAAGIKTNLGITLSDIANSTTLAQGVGSIELGHASNTTISRVSAGRIAVEGNPVINAKPRVGSTASSATPSINCDTTDMYAITALAANITSVTVTGTPGDGQRLLVRIKDNGTARTIAWGGAFRASGSAPLLTATVAGKTHLCSFIYDSSKSDWIAVATDDTGY